MYKAVASLFLFVMLAACTNGYAVRDLKADAQRISTQKTFALQPVRPNADVVLVAPGRGGDVVTDAIYAVLRAKGYDPADSNPDLIVQYTAYLQQGRDPMDGQDYSRYTWYRVNPLPVADNKMGAGLSGYLVLRVVDAHSGDVVWTGVASNVASLENMTDPRLGSAVHDILAALPSRT